MKRILLIETGSSGGGSFGSVTTLALGLKARGGCPHVVFFTDNQHVLLLRAHNIPVYILQDHCGKTTLSLRERLVLKVLSVCGALVPAWVPFIELVKHRKAVVQLKKIIQQHGISLVHCNDHPVRDFFTIVLAKHCGVPCVSHIRTPRPRRATALQKKYMNEHVTFFIPVAEAVQDAWVAWGLSESKMKRVYNGISLCAFLGERQVSRERPFTIVCIGRMVEWKGQLQLLDVFQRYRQEGNAARLIFVGDGPDTLKVKERVRVYALDEHVEIVGMTDNVKQCYAEADLLILPSLYDACSRVLMEALLFGVPVIAYNAGGNPEVIMHEKTGLLVEPFNTEAMIDAINRLRHSDALREQCIAGGKVLVKKRFSMHQYVENVQKVYEAVARER